MLDLIKSLAREGFQVEIIKITSPERMEIHGTPSVVAVVSNKRVKKYAKRVNKVVEGGLKDNLNNNPKSLLTAEMVESESTVKRINWKTIQKIKDCKEDGMSSKKTAEELGLNLPTVNKYWVD